MCASHPLRVSRSAAVELGAVADNVELVALINLVYALDPGLGFWHFHCGHLLVGEWCFPESYLAKIRVGHLAVVIAKQIEIGVYLITGICCFILDNLLAVHINLCCAVAHGEDDTIPSVVPYATIVAAQGTDANLTLADEEFAVVGIRTARLEQTVVGVSIRHFQVHHKGERH